MARKKIAGQEPTVSAEGTAAAPAVAPAAGSSSNANKARAPRSSANAVTHRHKPVTTPETQTPAESTAEVVVSAKPAPGVMQTPAAPTPTPRIVEAPTYREIAVRAYLLAESRGFHNGTPEDDWFAAERQLWNERTAG